MAKQIKSKLNEVMAYLANVGYKGKTKTVKFQPRRKGKTFVNRPCAKEGCGYKLGIVFQGFEDKNLFLVWCPKCNKISFPKPATDNRVGETDDDKCKGRTKKKAPCKNRAMANGYCNAHQDQANDGRSIDQRV